MIIEIVNIGNKKYKNQLLKIIPKIFNLKYNNFLIFLFKINNKSDFNR